MTDTVLAEVPGRNSWSCICCRQTPTGAYCADRQLC